MKSNILPLTTGTYYITLRQDFLLLCQACTYRKDKSRSSAHCKALILSVLENWTNKKIDGGKDLHISMTMPQWKESLYGMYGENVITDSLEELLHEELIGREKFRVPGMSGKDQYKYVLKYRVITERLETLKNTGLIEGKPVNFRDEPVNFSVQTSKNTGLPSSQTLKSTDYVDNAQNHTIESTRSRSTHAHNDASVSSESLEEQTDAEAEETPKPAVLETRREIQNACFTEKDELALWGLLRSTGFAKRDKPNDRQRQNVADLAKNLHTRHFEVEWVTDELLEKSFEWQATVKNFKNRNKEVGNVVTCLPDYIDAGLACWAIPEQSTSEIEPPCENEAKLNKSVYWTRYPDQAFRGDYRGHLDILEKMSVREARQYRRVTDETYAYYAKLHPDTLFYSAFSEEEEQEIERLKVEMTMREAVEA